MKVLIVDGSKDRRRELTEILADLHNVVVQGAVSDVRTALRAVVEVGPDVVITDVTLPDGDGTYLIERIRKMARMPSVVVLARRASEEQRLHYLAAGADRYLEAVDATVVRTALIQMAQTRLAAGSIPVQESQRLLGRMAAGVVHDFNNYLQAADVSLELIERMGPNAELVANARCALDAMIRLNATLLAYARGGVPTTTQLDLGDVVSHTLTLVRRLVPANVTVKLDVTAGARPVVGVRSELEQLVLNLVINACDAMPAGGTLEVSVRGCTTQAVLLAVADSGNGIDLPALEDSQSTKRTGLGLGLSIVRNVVAQQGGALRIVPRSTGGTMVAVMLPAAANRRPS